MQKHYRWSNQLATQALVDSVDGNETLDPCSVCCVCGWQSARADKCLAAGPDFAVALYPGHMLEDTTQEFDLNPTIPVTSNTPPTFLLQAESDPVDDVKNSLVYYIALHKAAFRWKCICTRKAGTRFACVARSFRLPNGPSCWTHGCEQSG